MNLNEQAFDSCKTKTYTANNGSERKETKKKTNTCAQTDGFWGA